MADSTIRDSRLPAPKPSVYELPTTLLELAVAIADEAARADVETYSMPDEVDGEIWNNLNTPAEDLQRHAEDRALAHAVISRGMDYIRQRGAALPYRVEIHPCKSNLVLFRNRK